VSPILNNHSGGGFIALALIFQPRSHGRRAQCGPDSTAPKDPFRKRSGGLDA
jgi:hypothetical protein